MTEENNLSSTRQSASLPDKKNNVKIELMVCQAGGHNCREHLRVINEHYSEATFYHSEKDYINSIKSLKNAYVITDDLNKESCIRCAALFRSTITDSLQSINKELHNLTSGFFRKKRYITSYVESCNVLNELKKTE